MNRSVLFFGVVLLLAATATPAAAISWKNLRAKLHTWLTEPLSETLGDPYSPTATTKSASAQGKERLAARSTATSARATADEFAASSNPSYSEEFEGPYASYQAYAQDPQYQPAYDYLSAKIDAHHQIWSPMAATQAEAAQAAAMAEGEGESSYEPSYDNRPRFCGDQDCPRFDLKDTYEDIDLRTYAPSTWAWTEVEGKGAAGFDRAQIVGFQRLFKYIVGDNELEEKIDMAVPVVTAVYLNKDREIKDHFTTSFFLPFRYQVDEHGAVDPPAPRDKRVHVTDLKKHQAYVLPFDGYALGFRVKKLGLDFMDYVRRNIDSHIDESLFLVATYDPPYKPFDRHNEIWVLRRRKAGAGEDDSGDESKKH